VQSGEEKGGGWGGVRSGCGRKQRQQKEKKELSKALWLRRDLEEKTLLSYKKKGGGGDGEGVGGGGGSKIILPKGGRLQAMAVP